MLSVLTRLAFAAAAIVLIAVTPLLALSFSGGAPPAFDGFQDNCTACHGSFALNSGTGGVSVEAPQSFVAGVPVEITVRVNNTTEADPNGAGQRAGFEVGVRDADGTPVGSFDLQGSTDIRLTSNGVSDWVTQTSAGTQRTEWTFAWIPPASGPPPTVTIYAVGNAANGDRGTAGDYIYSVQRPLALATTAEVTPEDGGIRLGPVAPNPLRSVGRATVHLREAGRVSVRLVDMRGRTVRSLAEGPRPAGESEIAVDATGLSAGMYFLVVEHEEWRRTGRVLVAR